MPQSNPTNPYNPSAGGPGVQLLTYNELNVPEIQQKIQSLSRKEEISGLSTFFKLNAPIVTSVQREFTHYEDKPFVTSPISNGSSAGSGAGAPVTITLAAVCHYNSGKASMAIKYIVVDVGGVQCRAESVNTSTANAHTMTLKPLIGAETIPATTSGQTLVFLGWAFPEGSDIDPRQWVGDLPSFKNYTQIFRKPLSDLTGSAQMQPDYRMFDVSNENSLFRRMFPKATRFQYDFWSSVALTNFELEIYRTFMFGKASDNLTDTSTTQGIVPEYQALGVNQPYSIGMGITLFDFQAIANNVRSKIVNTNEYSLFSDQNYYNSFEQLLPSNAQIYTDAPISYGSFKGDKDIAINMNFKSVYISGFSFHMKALTQEFYHPGVYGNTPQFKNFAVGIPTLTDGMNNAVTQVYRADSSTAFNPLNNVGGVTKNRGHFTFDGTGSNFGGAMPEMVNSTKDSRTIVVSCERGIQIKYASVGLIMQGS